MQAKSYLKLVPPTGANRAVPKRRPNTEYRKREHLTPTEVAKLIEAAKSNRYGQRDGNDLSGLSPRLPRLRGLRFGMVRYRLR